MNLGVSCDVLILLGELAKTVDGQLGIDRLCSNDAGLLHCGRALLHLFIVVVLVILLDDLTGWLHPLLLLHMRVLVNSLRFEVSHWLLRIRLNMLQLRHVIQLVVLHEWLHGLDGPVTVRVVTLGHRLVNRHVEGERILRDKLLTRHVQAREKQVGLDGGDHVVFLL